MAYAPDARIVAEALAYETDYLVTHDQEHLLRNLRLKEKPRASPQLLPSPDRRPARPGGGGDRAAGGAQAISLPVQLDRDAPFEPQLRALMADLPLTPEALHTEPIVVNLPSLNFSPNHRMPERVLN